MKKHARLAMALSALTVALSAAGGLIVGCGGDDDDGVDLGDSGGGGIDATASDGNAFGDGNAFPDVSTDDGSSNDASDGATTDSATNDGSTGGGDGSTADGGDGGDGGEAGLPLDAGAPDPTGFAHQIVVLTCQLLSTCCTGSPTTSSFDFAHCERIFEDPGDETAAGLAGEKLFAPSLDGGRVQFDPAMAQQCFDDIRALGCGTSSGETMLKLRADCNAAVKGTVGDGGVCTGSAECVTPLHCTRSPEADGGTGTCAPPFPKGAACGPGLYLEAIAQCGARLTGVPGYCANAITMNASQTCQPQLPLDAGCYVDYECASGVCGDTTDPVLVDAGAGACGTSVNVVDPSTCSQYVIQDAGHD